MKSYLAQKEIEGRIFTLRSLQVMIDRDLAELYGVDTKVLNQAVKRNSERFPDSFRFQLSVSEKNELVTNCDRFNILKHSSALPYAFTEQGVAMLSAVLKSDTAVNVSIQIMNAFVKMRSFIINNAVLFQRLDKIEIKQIESDRKFEQIFKALESRDSPDEKGIFFEGQVFDAYVFVSKIIKNAKKSIILIDNYIDESVLTMFTKRKKTVKAVMFTGKITPGLELDLKKHNRQYEPIEIHERSGFHDRFLIIDEKQLYHIGASLKDLGKKWFAFSRMDLLTNDILNKLKSSESNL